MKGNTCTIPQADWKPPQGDGLGETIKALAISVVLSMPVAGLGFAIIYGDAVENRRQLAAAFEREQAYIRLVSGPALPQLPVHEVTRGRDLFLNTCSACHGQNGKGVSGLGKDLTTSTFIAASEDPSLHAFLVAGRPLAKPLPMPPRGGNPDLTDGDLSDIVAYVRGLQDPRRMPALPEPTVTAAAAPTDDEKAKFLAAAGGDEELAEYIAYGSKIYATSCAACHGKDAKGVAGNGKNLVDSTFCKSLDDDGLLAFLKKGRDPSDPANTTGVGMPAKGGNPALSDDDLLDVIAYVRSLQTASK